MRRRLAGTTLALGLGCLGFAQSWHFVKIDPRGTYLRDSQWAPPASFLEFAESEFDATPERPLPIGMLQIRTVGWFNRALDNPASRNIDNIAVAVFSSGLDLDPDWTLQHRVPMAVDAGSDFYTLPTWIGGHATDIGEDFGIGSSELLVPIPTVTRALFFTAFDNGFWNNGDDFSNPGADPRGFGVEWRVIPAMETPEPASAGAMVAVIGLMGLLRRRRP